MENLLIEKQEKADSITVIAIEKFPKGNLANIDMVKKFQIESDLKKKEEIHRMAEANKTFAHIS